MNTKKLLYCTNIQKECFKTHFFEGVKIDDETITESILNWINRLNQQNIFVDKFSFLFDKYTEISFPIKVSGTPRRLLIEDSNRKLYHLWYNQYIDIHEYSIGKRTKYLELEVTYSLSTENNISLKQYELITINQKNLKNDTQITFFYNYRRTSTKVTLETSLQNTSIQLEILYALIDLSYDTQVAIECFNLISKSSHISNIFELLEHLLNNMRKIIEPKTIYTMSSCMKTDWGDNI